MPSGLCVYQAHKGKMSKHVMGNDSNRVNLHGKILSLKKKVCFEFETTEALMMQWSESEG